MPIIYKTGDVVEAFKNGEIDVLVHGVNCQGKMNSGIAKQIRNEFFTVFTDYASYCHGMDSEELLGDIHYVRNVLPGRHIFNAFTQEEYGYDGDRFCSYDAIDRIMRIISTDGIEGKIAMPKIGAGLGGGDWNVIEAIINGRFSDRDIYVYTLAEVRERAKI